jgi:Spy/CpxP family protein refolding chaperone
MLKLPMAVLALALSSAALAQDAPESAAPKFPSPPQVVQYLADKLALTDEQKNAIAPIIAGRQQKVQAALAENNAGTMQRRREMRGIFSDSDRQIKAILTPDQQQKYGEIERQRVEQMKQRMLSK